MTDNINNTNTCSASQHQLNTLQRVDGFMNSIADLDHLLEQIMRESRRATGAESCSLALYNPATHDFSFEIVLGDKSPETKQERVRYGEGIIGLVAQTGTPQNIPDVYADKSFTPRFDQKTGFKTRNLLAVPMSRRSKLIGVIEVLNKASAEGFSSDDQSLLELLAHQAAIAIENARLYSASLSKERLASLGEGISGAAHCIKNIANLISFGSGSIELAIKNNNMDLVEKAWKAMQQGADRITELTNDMLSYAKSQSPYRESTDVNAFLSEIILLSEPACLPNNIMIKTDFNPQLPPAPLDRGGIHRCLMNLITNARDVLAETGGTITLRTDFNDKKGTLLISITDNGPGIEAEDMKAIFDVFFSTKGSHGTGLGLSTTKKIVTEHGGRIVATSDPGIETTFSIMLPLQSEAACAPGF